MTTPAWSVQQDTPMAALVREVAGNGHHHVPVIDADGRLVGMLTQSDMIAALYRQLALQPGTGQVAGIPGPVLRPAQGEERIAS